MNPRQLLQMFYKPGSQTYEILIQHGELITRKALAIADSVAALAPDRNFIAEAAMLHDIGIFLTASPTIGCTGSYPYICHGYLGRAILEEWGLAKHALVCERHVGVGISVADIRQFSLPLPERDMIPATLEEQIICYADKFFSKNGHGRTTVKGIEAIIQSLEPYGPEKVQRFKAWAHRFEGQGGHVN
jgi:uncharacterized protein